jgi:hypothetical protein
MTGVKVKGEVGPVHARKMFNGSRGVAPLILSLGNRLRRMFIFMLYLLYIPM